MAKTSRIVRFARHDQRTIFLDHIENICRHSQRLVCGQGRHIAKLPCVIGKSIRTNRPWWQCMDGPGRWPIKCLRAIVRTKALWNKLSSTGRRENLQHFLDTGWRHQHTSWNLQPLSLSDPSPKELIRNFGRITARYCQRAFIQQSHSRMRRSQGRDATGKTGPWSPEPASGACVRGDKIPRARSALRGATKAPCDPGKISSAAIPACSNASRMSAGSPVTASVPVGCVSNCRTAAAGGGASSCACPACAASP